MESFKSTTVTKSIMHNACSAPLSGRVYPNTVPWMVAVVKEMTLTYAVSEWDEWSLMYDQQKKLKRQREIHSEHCWASVEEKKTEADHRSRRATSA